MRIRMLVSSVAVTVLCLGTLSCGAKQAGNVALKEFEVLTKSSSVQLDDFLKYRKRVVDLPETVLTADEQALRVSLYRSSDTLLATLTTTELDASVAVARAEATVAARRLAENAAPPNSPASFFADLKQATKEVIEEQGCELVLDSIAPPARPSDGGSDGAAETNPAFKVIQKLSQRWTRTSLDQTLQWVEYGESIAADAQQFASAVAVNQGDYVQFLSRPQVLRAAAAYLRACYAPPRPISP
ncbi:hypothetical protein ACX80E_09670 [Arthrobacter sp. TMN-49]